MITVDCGERMEGLTMKRCGEDFILSEEFLDTIAALMDDETREAVHAELAPCTPDSFLKRYLEISPAFESILDSEFGITI